MSDPRFPIGPFRAPETFGADERVAAFHAISVMPGQLRRAVDDLDDTQLDTPYREGGWTVRQVVHHLADSHMNSYVRVRLTLTEDNPVIRPYDEVAWADLPDGRMGYPELSLAVLDALHARWIALLRVLSPEDFDRPYQHPDTGTHTLGYSIAFYAWHGAHHVAHITDLRNREGW